MSHVGVDIEQFVVDPYGSGIQRVLQYLARSWPADMSADFVVPRGDRFLLLTPEQASDLFDLAFAGATDDDLRGRVSDYLDGIGESVPEVDIARLVSLYSGWILPEVSYLESVHARFQLFARIMPAAMIGYDTLPMTHPENYRFTPGSAARVSEYFRLLREAPMVTCISEFSRNAILDRLRRRRDWPIDIAHPGGDHIPVQEVKRPTNADNPVQFVRVGTLERRKSPIEIVEAFSVARSQGVDAELTFIGRPSASDSATSAAVSQAVAQGNGVRWVSDASDQEVHEWISRSDVFLSIGVEGYGIPVLEAIRRGTGVVYGGIQPAGELMRGRGAEPWHDTSIEGLIEMFSAWSRRDRVGALLDSVDPQGVPRWADFARAVATSVARV